MNLEQAHTLSQLSLPKRVPVKEQVQSAKRVALSILARCEKGGYPYEHFPVNEEGARLWRNKFLTSKKFVLTRINLSAAAAAHDPRDPKRVKYYIRQIAANADNVKRFDPLVIDVNRRKEGRTHLGYIPDVIFVDGKHRRKAMLACGIQNHLAWVGVKALKKLKAKDIIASNDSDSNVETVLPKIDGTKIASQYEMMCATVPVMHMPARQDTGSAGSRPKDHMHSSKKIKGGGPGSGCQPCHSYQNPYQEKTSKDKEEMEAGGQGSGRRSDSGDEDLPVVRYGEKKPAPWEDIKSCGARSSGSIEDSDSSSPTFNPNKPQKYVPGTGPGYTKRFSVDPAQASPGSGSGPRVINKGASKSEMARNLEAKSVKSAVKVKKMWTKKKMQAVAPPGMEDMVKALKPKVGKTSAFKIAWNKHNKGGK